VPILFAPPALILRGVSSSASFSSARALYAFRHNEVSRRVEPDKHGEMELTLDFVNEICPDGGKANVMSGFSAIVAYTCHDCGEVVRLSDDPDVERLFGPKSAPFPLVRRNATQISGALVVLMPLCEFRRTAAAIDVAIAPTTTLELSVEAAISTHTVPLRRVFDCLERVGSPRKRVVKGRLSEMLGTD
jgi:hypothetical protein